MCGHRKKKKRFPSNGAKREMGKKRKKKPHPQKNRNYLRLEKTAGPKGEGGGGEGERPSKKGTSLRIIEKSARLGPNLKATKKGERKTGGTLREGERPSLFLQHREASAQIQGISGWKERKKGCSSFIREGSKREPLRKKA